MTTAEINRIKGKITAVLSRYAHISPTQAIGLLPTKSLQGKLYEAHVLAYIIEKLVTEEHFQVTLVRGGTLKLRQKGGPINRTYPYFEVRKNGEFFGELFTDIYFSTLSYDLRGRPIPLSYGDYHELDIALLRRQEQDYPAPYQIMLAIECKNTSIKKNMIREVLGFRRELSILIDRPLSTDFENFPINQIEASPNSVHMFFCSDRRILRFSNSCRVFGILLEHYTLNR